MGESATCESVGAFISHLIFLDSENRCRTLMNWENSKRNSKMHGVNFRYYASLVKLLNLTNHSVYHHAKDPSQTGCCKANGKTSGLSCLSSDVNLISRVKSRRSLL